MLANPGVKYPVLAGLAEDYIGYIVPAYNYVLNPDNPYLTKPTAIITKRRNRSVRMWRRRRCTRFSISRRCSRPK